MFSQRVRSLFTNIYNGGNVEVPFTVSFRAMSEGIKNPSIFKVGTREFIKINRVMSVGETIIVTNTNESIEVVSFKSGISEDVFAFIDIDSTFFLLNRGDNILKYDADENAENLDVRVSMRDAAVGVW
jgi:hypothetical protein